MVFMNTVLYTKKSTKNNWIYYTNKHISFYVMLQSYMFYNVFTKNRTIYIDLYG